MMPTPPQIVVRLVRPGSVHALDVRDSIERRQRDRAAGRRAALLALEELGLRVSAPDIVNEATGRPVVAGHPDVAVSVAHSFGWGVAGVTHGPGRVGVDVEHLRAGMPELGPFLCHAREAAGLAGGPLDVADPHGALAVWVAKEAIGKLLGLGLRVGPRRIELSRQCAGCDAVHGEWRVEGMGDAAGAFAVAGGAERALAVAMDLRRDAGEQARQIAQLLRAA